MINLRVGFPRPIVGFSASGTTYQWNEISHQIFSLHSDVVVISRKDTSDTQFLIEDDVYGLSTEVE